MNPIDSGPHPLNTIPVEDKPIDPNAPKCVACGHWHGGGGTLELLCLRREVVRLRALLDALAKEAREQIAAARSGK